MENRTINYYIKLKGRVNNFLHLGVVIIERLNIKEHTNTTSIKR